MERRLLIKTAALSSYFYFLNKFSGNYTYAKINPKLLVGISSQSKDNFLNELKSFEDYIHFNHDIFQYFSSFDYREKPDMVTPYFYALPLKIWNFGKIPLITWYPSTSFVTKTPPDICQRIYSGMFDKYLFRCCNALSNFLKEAKDNKILGTPKIYIRFAHEMNINTREYGKNPTDFIKMWKYVHNFLRSKGLKNDKLQLIFCVNNNDVKTEKFEEYYPGDSFVDWNAIDAYNWNWKSEKQWKPLSEILQPSLERMNKLSSKPISISEFGTTAKTGGTHKIIDRKLQFSGNSVNLNKKSEWISETFKWLSDDKTINKYNIKMIIYFNYSLKGDIDSGLYISTKNLINNEDLTYKYEDYKTINNLQDVYIKNSVGFINNKVFVGPNEFAGKF